MTQSAAAQPTDSLAAIAPDRLTRLGLLAIVAWLFLQGTLRILTAASLGIDEAQLMVTTQTLAWGYGAQPPLYTWLQYGVFALFGPSIPTLVYTKEAMLAGTFLLFFLASRLVLAEERRALVATLLLFTIPQIVWESQRALSHSVLVVLLGAVALYLFLRVLRDGRPADYVLLGLSIGLGLLSKYNFAILAIALVGAALLSETGRRRLVSRWFALSLLIAALVSAPHFYWGLTHLDQMLSSSDKFAIGAGASVLDRFALPLLGAGIAIASFSAITVLVAVLVAFAPPRREPDLTGAAGWSAGSDFVIRLLLVAIAVVVVTPLFSGATVVMDRWLMPVLFFLPLPLLVVTARRLTPVRLRMLGGLSVLSAVLSSAGLTTAALLPDMVGSGLRGTEPYAVLSEAVRREAPDPAYILATTTSMSGNLKLAFPRALVVNAAAEVQPAANGEARTAILAWTGSISVPEELAAQAAALCNGAPLDLPEPTRLREPYERSRTLFLEMSYIIVPDCLVSAQPPAAP